MDSLLSVIAIWLSVNFGLPVADLLPKIEFHPEEAVSRRWIESVARHHDMDLGVFEREIQHLEVQAFYDDRHMTIFLTDDWDSKTPRDVSVLVHEFVHHLQNLDGRTYDCPSAREELAYEAQDAWLGLFGTSLEIEFAIDPMTLLVNTKCMH